MNTSASASGGRGSPVGLCPHSPMLMTTVVSWCCITLVTLAAGWADGNASRNKNGILCVCGWTRETRRCAWDTANRIKWIYWLVLKVGCLPSSPPLDDSGKCISFSVVSYSVTWERDANRRDWYVGSLYRVLVSILRLVGCVVSVGAGVGSLVNILAPELVF